MVAYILRRLVSAVSVVAVTLVVSFLLFFVAPTDPVGSICGAKCTPQRVEDITRSMHLDDPWFEQLGLYVKGIFVGRDYTNSGLTTHCAAPCLGYSYKTGLPVTTLIGKALPVTISIVVVSSILYFGIAILVGVWAARRRGRPSDRVMISTSLAMSSIPYPVVALIAAVYVAGVFMPQEHWTPLTQNPQKWASGLLVAWLALTFTNVGGFSRYARNSMIESINEDFTRTARAKGLTERRVIYRHALRAGITPMVTLYGLDVALNLGGAFFTEFIFGLPGLGVLTLRAFSQSDLPIIMGGVLVATVFVVVLNLIVDLLYAVLDPRVRLS